MPAGVSWSKYFTFVFASLASALAGSQAVHLYYRPSLVGGLCYFVTIKLPEFQNKDDLFVFNIIIHYHHKICYPIVWNQWDFS